MSNEQNESIRADAARYRWLRSQHWNNSPMAVVVNPKKAVVLGHDCPSLDRLDAAIDAEMNTAQLHASNSPRAKMEAYLKKKTAEALPE